MFSKFQEWYIEGKHTDIKIVCKASGNNSSGGKQNIIHAHKAVIGSQSPWLERMVYDEELKTEGRESLLILQLRDFEKFENFKLMLEYLYKFPITPQTLVPIFDAGIKYQVGLFRFLIQSFSTIIAILLRWIITSSVVCQSMCERCEITVLSKYSAFSIYLCSLFLVMI